MSKAKLADLHDLGEIARAFGVQPERIELYAESDNQQSFYDRLKIAKLGRGKRGQYRVVYKAKHEWLGQFHRGVAMAIVRGVNFGDHVQGFVKRRSIRSNAQLHLGAKLLLHGDITNFFDSITTTQVERSFLSIGAHPSVAALLAKACTIDGYVRQGTRCSPVIANIVCRTLDMEMLSLASSFDSKYSRYADDITFSGDTVPTQVAVENVIQSNGFSLRNGHCYIQRRGRSQFVTGLTIVDDLQPRLPRRLKRRLRLVCHYIHLYGEEAHFERDRGNSVVDSPGQLWGMLRFVHSIEPTLAKRLWRKIS